MKKPTNLRVVLSVREMRELIRQAEENQRREPAMSDEVVIPLCEDTDYYSCLRPDFEKPGKQFSGYQECYPMTIDFTKLK
jgi:hypothetical protein